MKLDDHPTVLRWRAHHGNRQSASSLAPLGAAELRQLALDCGADDAGLVEISRPALDPQREEILHHYPWARTLLSYVVRMNRSPVRSPARSVANLEFHHVGEETDEVGHRIVRHLEGLGLRAVNPAMGFPMEMAQFPDSPLWVVSHKPVAVAAGLGQMGIHRNLIHPKFGNFVLLGTVLIDVDVDEYGAPIDYNPCLECKLCVAACPVGAIASDGGHFDFSACFTHNYREFMGGFTDWVEQVADSKDALDYRSRHSEPETASIWQSLSYGANYKSAYCMAVCPAGEDVIGPFLTDRKRHLQDVVRPLQEKPEPVYVVKGSDAEAHVRKHGKTKFLKHVGNALRPRSIEGLLFFMPLVFQREQSKGLDATYHFIFTGSEARSATVVIRDQTISVADSLKGAADLSVKADSRTWLGFLAKERSLVWALLTGRIRLKGSPRLLIAFGKCFPGAGVRHERAVVLPHRSRMRREPHSFHSNDPATRGQPTP